jgi:two-component system, sensor histidine kinase and response regulator
LRSISGYVNILKEDYEPKLDDDAKLLLRNISQSTQRMNILIDSLLKFSKLDKKPLTMAKVDMDSIVKDIVTEYRSEAPSTEFHIEPLMPAVADLTLITQVWINFISNAIKYSSKKKFPEIRIGSTTTGTEVIYHVKDNGAGFSMDYTNKLFGVFQRLHKREEFQGTGVGLALVKRIVAKHNGRVWAEGKVNEGANFYFSLPTNGINDGRSDLVGQPAIGYNSEE